MACSLVTAVVLALALASPAGAVTREYWVAAEPVSWNVVPNGHDALEHHTFPTSATIFDAVTYRLYSRDWRRPLRGARIPGPLLRARVGDRLLVHFKNLDHARRNPHSMHFHGVEYRASSDGSYIPGFSGRGASVGYGETFIYRLTAGKDSTGVWPYHDHSKSMHESLAGGMYGALSIYGRRERLPYREFVVAFSSTHGFNTINGRAFVSNTPVYKARVGDLVQWDVIAIGDDHHTFHVHGHRWRGGDGVPLDTRTIGPAESFRVRWREDAPGDWLYHCHVESHMATGMVGLYRVSR